MIRIGIIGCGKIAQVRHLPEYAANPHVELAGYYDLNTQRAQEMAAQYGGKVYDSYFDLLNDPSIDAVSICVENHLRPVCREARSVRKAHGRDPGRVRVHGGRRRAQRQAPDDRPQHAL